MKKLLLVFAIAAFVACNDSGNPEEGAKTDTPAAPTEVAPPAPTPDSTGSDTTKVDTSSLKK